MPINAIDVAKIKPEWEEFAKVRGGECDFKSTMDNVFSTLCMNIVVGGVKFEFTISDTKPLCAKVVLNAKLECDVTISKRTIFDCFLPSFWMHRIFTGDSNFDSKVLIISKNKHLAGKVVHDSWVKDYLRENDYTSLILSPSGEKAIMSYFGGFSGKISTIELIIELMSKIQSTMALYHA